jgi:hypothetical protein
MSPPKEHREYKCVSGCVVAARRPGPVALPVREQPSGRPLCPRSGGGRTAGGAPSITKVAAKTGCCKDATAKVAAKSDCCKDATAKVAAKTGCCKDATAKVAAKTGCCKDAKKD